MPAPTRELTAEEKRIALEYAAKGASLTGIAHALRFTRDELRGIRSRDKAFDADLMFALFRYEAKLLEEAAEGDVNERVFATRELARRFPQRHGIDPKLRTDRDERICDESEAQPSSDSSLADALEVFLEARKAGKL